MDWLETRQLAYFVAVAEELHFGRAAERLGIAQPPLSRAIRRLESRMGVALLERDSRHVALTDAGRVLLEEGRRALDAVSAANRRTQQAGRRNRTLGLAIKPGVDAGLLPEILATYESDPDALPVELQVCGPRGQAVRLRDGRADVALLHDAREDLTGFDAEELLVEGQVVVVPADHRLAARAFVSLSDLSADPTPRWSPDNDDAEVRDAGELMQLIALGRAIAVLPESARGHIRQDLVCVPVPDAPPARVVVAWPEQTTNPAVAAFVRAAAAAARKDRALTVE